MSKQDRLSQLVSQSYISSDQTFGQWSWENHVQVVAKKAQELAERFAADVDLAVAGALLHDFGDAFVHRSDPKHTEISQSEGRKFLQQAGYTDQEIEEVLNVIIPPHSCRDGEVPKTIEGKVLATADALAHLTSDFYLQFAWMHLPESAQNFSEFREWAQNKIERDFNKKIQFDEIKSEVEVRYLALKQVFTNI